MNNILKRFIGFLCNRNLTEPIVEPKTHDYTQRYWGHDYTITDVIDEGQQIKAMGWGHGLCVGDYIRFGHEASSGGDTHYRIDEIKYYDDPRDMWSALLTFPRKLK